MKPSAPDDQARTLRLMLATERVETVSGIVRRIEEEEERRDTTRISAFRSARGDSRPDIWSIPHRLIAVVGGRPNAGATTVARNMATEAGHRGIRTEFVGSSGPRATGDGADFYLLDAGYSPELVGLVDFLVVVATPDEEGVLGSYAAIKRFRGSDPALPAGVVVNFAGTPGEGAALAERIAAAARSFLGGTDVEILGWVLDDPVIRRAGEDAAPFVETTPCTAAASGIRLCVRRLWSRWRPKWKSAA